MVNSERTGMFNKDNAIKHSVPRGYLYSCFKKGQNFILPDGYIVQSKDFIRGYYLGSKATLINSTIRKREMTMVKNTVYVMH